MPSRLRTTDRTSGAVKDASVLAETVSSSDRATLPPACAQRTPSHIIAGRSRTSRSERKPGEQDLLGEDNGRVDRARGAKEYAKPEVELLGLKADNVGERRTHNWGYEQYGGEAENNCFI